VPPSVLTCHCKLVPVPVPFAVKEAGAVSHTVMLAGLLVITGKALTVKVAAEVAIDVQVPVPVNRYLLLLIEAVTALMLRVAVFTPEYGVPLVILFQLVPPSVLSCHCRLVALVTAVKLAVEPAHMVVLDGLVVMTAFALIVNTAAVELTAGVQVPDTVKRYLLLFNDTAAGLIESVPVVAPVYGAALVTLVQVAPPSVLTCHCMAAPAPVPFAVNEVDVPSHTVVFTGLPVITGDAVTLKVAPFETTSGVQVPVTSIRYLKPSIAGVVAIIFKAPVAVPV
jgi:hypothetical protein